MDNDRVSHRCNAKARRARGAKALMVETSPLAARHSMGGEDHHLPLSKVAIQRTMMVTEDDRRPKGLGMISPLLHEV